MDGGTPRVASEDPTLLIFFSQEVFVWIALFPGHQFLSQPLFGMNEITEMHFFIVVQDTVLRIDYRIVERISWLRNPCRLRSSTSSDDIYRFQGIPETNPLHCAASLFN